MWDLLPVKILEQQTVKWNDPSPLEQNYISFKVSQDFKTKCGTVFPDKNVDVPHFVQSFVQRGIFFCLFFVQYEVVATVWWLKFGKDCGHDK